MIWAFWAHSLYGRAPNTVYQMSVKTAGSTSVKSFCICSKNYSTIKELVSTINESTLVRYVNEFQSVYPMHPIAKNCFLGHGGSIVIRWQCFESETCFS